MKVVILEYFLPGSTYTLEYCQKLCNHCEVVLICKDNFSYEKKSNFKIYNILHSSSKNMFSSLFQYISDLLKIKSIVKKEKPDIFHVEGIVHSKFESLLISSIKKMKIKTCFTAHNILSHEEVSGEKKELNRWYSFFDGIVVHNETCKLMLLANSDYNGKMCVMPHGSYEQFSIQDKKNISKQEKTTFLQFGQVRDYKGIELLLDAIEMLSADERKKMHFIIAGSQKKNRYPCDLADLVNKKGIEDCVELILRRINDDEIPVLFEKADCCLFPYKHIYGSGALLMAYSFCKPVIASDIPVFCEETDNGKAGILFKANNKESLSNALRMFSHLSENEVEVYSDNVMNLRNNKYNWDYSSNVAFNFYKELIQ